MVARLRGHDRFFCHVQRKNAKSNISTSEEKALKLIAKNLFNFSDAELIKQFESGALIEVDDGKE